MSMNFSSPPRVRRAVARAGCRPTGGTVRLDQRDKVQCGIEVSVDHESTVLADKGALGQPQLGFHCFAGRAGSWS